MCSFLEYFDVASPLSSPAGKEGIPLLFFWIVPQRFVPLKKRNAHSEGLLYRLSVNKLYPLEKYGSIY